MTIDTRIDLPQAPADPHLNCKEPQSRQTASAQDLASHVVGTAIDTALSSPDIREVRGTTRTEHHLRQLGERARDATFGFLYEQQFGSREEADKLSMEDTIRLLHRVSTLGIWVDQDPDHPLEGGEYRRLLVEFGDKIAPDLKDVSSLMAAFAHTLEKLMASAPVADADLLATWGYVLLMSIHPFADGNGRTARALVEYIRYSIAQSRGLQYQPLRLKSREVLADMVSEVQYSMGLFDRALPMDRSTTENTARNAFVADPIGYFEDVRDRIHRAISLISEAEQLEEYPDLVALSNTINSMRSWKDYQTKSFAAEEAGAAYQNSIDGQMQTLREKIREMSGNN